VAYTKPRAILQRGTRANQPAAADVAEGTLYDVTDEELVERSTGAAWEYYAYSPAGSVLGGIFTPDTLRMRDSNDTHALILAAGSNITANRTLTLLTGDLDRTINAGAAQSYTPTWGSSGTAPTMGASTLVGAYIRLGKFIYFRALLTFGAGFSWGTGAHNISLPFNCALTDANLCLTQGLIGGGRYPGVGILTATTAVLFTNANPAGLWSGTAPAVWAVNDQLSVFGFYDESGS
jgi:hypothetical protein